MTRRFLTAYAATLVVMLVLDAIWLGAVATPLYQAGIGHLMAEQPRLGVAALFYFGYPLGLVIFGVRPDELEPGRARAALRAALFGCFAYGTYDLTNLATLKDWPVWLALLDTAWGTSVSAVAGLAGRVALEWRRAT